MNYADQIKPVVSEKSYNLANSSNKYTFYVPLGMNKIEIAGAIAEKYGVTVLSVNTTIKPGKMKRDPRYNTLKRKSDSKKAVVLLKDGDSIDDFINV